MRGSGWLSLAPSVLLALLLACGLPTPPSSPSSATDGGPPSRHEASPRPSGSPAARAESSADTTGGEFHRTLVEAEDLKIERGWRDIAVGEGNYMVDSIGASHVSGGRMLQAPADDD